MGPRPPVGSQPLVGPWPQMGPWPGARWGPDFLAVSHFKLCIKDIWQEVVEMEVSIEIKRTKLTRPIYLFGQSLAPAAEL